MSTKDVKSGAIVVWTFWILQLVCQVSGNEIKNLFLKDKSGTNLCTGELDCFANANTVVALDFNLVIDNPVNGLLFSIISDEHTKVTQLTKGFTIHACYDRKAGVILNTTCKTNTIPKGTYHLTYAVNVPQYQVENPAFLTILSNKGFSAFRNLVQW